MINELYLIALGATLCVEAPIVWFGYRKLVRPVWRVATVFLVANFFTHGLLWTVWDLLPDNYMIRVAGSEAAVWLIEAELYVRFFRGDPLRAIFLAAMANALSVGLGFIGWWAVGPGGGWTAFQAALGF